MRALRSLLGGNSSTHAGEFMFDLLQSFALSFRNTQKYKEKACEANTSVGPECPGGTKDAIENGKGEGQNKGSTPQSRHRNRDPDTANAIREDFRDQDPCHRGKG